MDNNGIEVIEYNDDDKTIWDEFVDNSSNGTVFHKQRFLEYHENGRFKFNHLLFYDGNELKSVLPCGLSGEMLKSPVGASFGGFVVKDNIGLHDADQLVKALMYYCSCKKIKEIFLTPPMQIYHKTFNEAVNYALHFNHFIQTSSLYSSVIDFSVIHDKDNLSKNTRHKINKAINKGVDIVETKDFDTFYPILLENKKKFGVKPTHTLSELKRIDELIPDMMTLFLAYIGNKPIAGELLFEANKVCTLNFYTMHYYEYRNLFPVNYLIEHAIRWCNEKKYRYYDYGVSANTFSIDPMDPSWSLIKYKESMGANGCQRSTYYRRVF